MHTIFVHGTLFLYIYIKYISIVFIKSHCLSLHSCTICSPKPSKPKLVQLPRAGQKQKQKQWEFVFLYMKTEKVVKYINIKRVGWCGWLWKNPKKGEFGHVVIFVLALPTTYNSSCNFFMGPNLCTSTNLSPPCFALLSYVPIFKLFPLYISKKIHKSTESIQNLP